MMPTPSDAQEGHTMWKDLKLILGIVAVGWIAISLVRSHGTIRWAEKETRACRDTRMVGRT